MTKLLKVMMWVLLGINIISCSAPPPKRYYTISNNLQQNAQYANSPLCALPLVVASVMAASPYEDDKIVFRSNDFEIRYYNYRFWVDPPEKMMMGLLQLRMLHSGLFDAVEYRINSASDYLALYVKLNAIEERDKNEKWYARLAMSFVLKTADNENIIWKHAFDVERPVEVKSALGVVATLSEIYNTELDDVMESLSSFLPTYAGCTKDTAEISSSECQ